MITREEVSELPLTEKLDLMEFLWEEIARDEAVVDTPEWRRDLLDEREAKIQSGEAEFISWENARREIDRRARLEKA